jgi:hypothetical protein
MAEGQVKNSFDAVTLGRIGKGILYAVILPAVIALLQYLGTIDFGNTTITMIVAFVIPTLVNIVKEFMKGKEVT